MPAGNSVKITEDQLKIKFVEYIDMCKKEPRLANIAGLCRYLDIDRETYYNYKSKFYIGTIKKMEEILEDESINSKAVSESMRIFYLKNKFGYKDKVETENVNTNLNVEVTDQDILDEFEVTLSKVIKK